MFDLHMHTTYCDGKNTAEEMILAAIDKDLDTVGLSGHSFTPHDTSYCMSREGSESYIREVRELAANYSGRIRVLTGIERDYYADITNESYDYVIGSLHYLFINEDTSGIPAVNESGSDGNASACLADMSKSGNTAAPVWTDVDDNPEKLIGFADRFFSGDMMCLAELYYKTMEDLVSKTDCDIIGHFDLITKFNERAGAGELIDTSDPRYTAAWKKAVDRIFEETLVQRTGGSASDAVIHPNRLEELGLFRAGSRPVFEINTGAISRGYRTAPYPAPDQIEYIKSKGGILILSSDSHSCDAIANRFDELKRSYFSDEAPNSDLR